MLFSGIPFLFYFLPAVLILYFLMPRKLKNGFLLFASLVFYGWGEPRYLLLMAAAIVLFYSFGLAIGAAKTSWVKKFWLTAAVLTGVVMLGVFKYADFALENWNRLTGMGVPLLKLALPIGISFYTFQCVSYAVDVYRNDVAPQRNIIHFGTYVALFPQLIAGPIVRYVDVAEQLEKRESRWEDVAQGLGHFLLGLGKKVLIANPLGELTAIFRETGEQSVLFYWIYAIAFMLHIYFDFGGYSDMAIGLGRIFGFRFPKNFNYPYISRSITEFWRRWHMTLGGWFRDYVYIPLGGNRVGKVKWLRNILAVWLLTGLWHGAAWNFVVWGLLFAACLLLEKWLPLQKLPNLLRHGYVLLIVLISFVIFNAADMTQALQDLAGLFGGLGLPLISKPAEYYLRSYGILLLVGMIGATPLPYRIYAFCQRRWPATGWLLPAGSLALLLVCTAYLVDGSFNPFLYFRF